MARPRRPDVRDLLHQTLLADARQRVDAVRGLASVLGGEPQPADQVPEPLADAAWDRVLELVDDPDRGVRRTVLHALADEAPVERRAEVDRALDRLGHDEDESLRRRARKVHDRFRRDRAA